MSAGLYFLLSPASSVDHLFAGSPQVVHQPLQPPDRLLQPLRNLQQGGRSGGQGRGRQGLSSLPRAALLLRLEGGAWRPLVRTAAVLLHTTTPH
jgi:hypothetical protein